MLMKKKRITFWKFNPIKKSIYYFEKSNTNEILMQYFLKI